MMVKISGSTMKDKRISIENIVFNILLEKKLKIGFCESCTGGLISGTFSRIAGASQVLDRSIVTYSNESKMEEVQVSGESLNEFGAVSKEVALEMAKGMLLHGNLDLTLSVTGIAGPATEYDLKPVGLVYICIATKVKHRIIELNLVGDRETIQNKTINRAFIEMEKFLLE